MDYFLYNFKKNYNKKTFAYDRVSLPPRLEIPLSKWRDYMEWKEAAHDALKNIRS